MYLLEKKMEKERSKAEALQEDITFKTKMGEQCAADVNRNT